VNTLERRLKLLKMEGAGFSRAEVVKALSEEYRVSARTVHRDYERRGHWQPLIQQLDPEKSLLTIVNRYEQIYRKASLISLQEQNPNAKVGALRIMLHANEKMCETMLLPGIMQDLRNIKTKLEIPWQA
jgi:hypothetical protein